MEMSAVIALVILVALGAFIGGAAFIVYYTQHIIKIHKYIPRYLKDVNVAMPKG